MLLQIHGVDKYNNICIAFFFFSFQSYHSFSLKKMFPEFLDNCMGNFFELWACVKGESNGKRNKEILWDSRAEVEDELWDPSLPQAGSLELWVNRTARSPRLLCMHYLLELVGIKLFHQAVL